MRALTPTKQQQGKGSDRRRKQLRKEIKGGRLVSTVILIKAQWHNAHAFEDLLKPPQDL
jgi:hypothetical protein